MYTVLFVSPTGIKAAAYVSKKSPVSSPYSYQMQNIDSSYSVRIGQTDANWSNQQERNMNQMAPMFIGRIYKTKQVFDNG